MKALHWHLLTIALPLIVPARHLAAQVGPASSPAPAQAETAPPTNRPPTVSVKEAHDHLIHRVDVPFPAMATAAHVFGTVVVGAEIDAEGEVTQVVALGGPEMLRAAALEGVRQYTYRPFLINGVPSVVRTAVQVLFQPYHTKSN